MNEFQTIDSNSSSLDRGKYLTKEDSDNIKIFLNECVRKFVLKRIEKRYLYLKEDLAEKKKNVKKGFLGLFKKEEKVQIVDGKYVFTEIEKALKDLADLGFSLGLFEIAYKEYKNLYDEIKKRDDFWSGLVIEKMIYCLLSK